MDKDEFAQLISEDLVTQKMDELGIFIPPEELAHTFDMLDVDENGVLTIEEFSVGLGQLQQSLSIKHVVAINYALQRTQNKLIKALNRRNHMTSEHLKQLTTTLMGLDDKASLLNTKVKEMDHRVSSSLKRTGSGALMWFNP